MKLMSSVNYTGQSSMEIGVRIESENPKTAVSHHTASAYLTFVSLDDKGKPQKVLPIKPETKDEIKRYEEGRVRSQERKDRLKKEQKQR